MSIPSRLQDLPPQWARFCLDIDRFVSRDLNLDLQGRTLLVALSGGADSVAMLLAAHLLRHRWQASLQAVHLNHNLRPEAEEDACFALSMCERLNIPCRTGSSSVAVYARRFNLGLEEAGRLLRYRFLFGVKRRHKAHFVLTGHHLNDLAEDMLLRLVRGTGWPHLAGMQAFDPETGLLRPLLMTPKEDLIGFLQSLGLSWREDRSNQDQAFTRNRIRHSVIPLLLQENANLLRTVEQMWRQARLDKSLFQQELEALRALEVHCPEGVLVPKEALADTHPALRLRWYRDVLNRLGPGQVLAPNLFALDRLMDRSGTVQFPGSKQVVVDRDWFRFQPGRLPG
jgi:tRNA(Ile)-lysidine synthase